MAFPLSAGELPASCEVAVVGAGIVGTAVAARLASAGVDVCLLERSGFAAGASSAGEGNLLLSDKLPGPELDFSVRSLQLWHRLVDRAGPFVELEEKGAVVVARDFSQMEELSSLARAHASAGVKVELLTGEELRELEPALSAEVAGGAYYPEDCQVQPMLAVAFQADELARSGGRAVAGVEVLGAGRHLPGARVTELVTSAGKICVGRFVVNAAGAWAGELARRLGDCVPVSPRKGQVLVTEPLANFLRHKVYEASYLGSVHAGEELSCAAVVESTPAGTVLIGSSRQSVGFAGEIDYAVAAELARRALALVPGLAGVRVMRAYVGFRPATPDRLPVIGPSTVVPNLVYATGHEGAGILLSQATAEVVASLVLGDELASSWQAFSAARFASETRAAALSEARAVAVAGGTGAQGEPGPGGADATLSGKSLASQVGRVAKVGDAKAAGMCRFSFDGRAFAAPVGSTVAGAILFNGLRAWRRTRQGGFPRGLFCGIGTCFDCLVDLNGHKAVRACLALLQDGDQVATSGSVGGGEGVPVGQSAPAGPHRRGSGGSCDVCVIGAGPAGLAAALAASRQGANVVVVDSGAREGGQFFRQPLAGESRLPDRLRALHRAPRVEVCLGEDVWSVSRTVGGFVVRTAGGGELNPRALVLATGASEVVLPFPGWELPGVVTAGAAQSLLKAEGLRVGGRVVVAGTGPFLLPVAAALAGAGAQVTLVEAASPARAPAAAGALLAYPAKAKEAASYAKVLALARARVLTGWAVVRCEGGSSVERAVVARLGRGWKPLEGTERALRVDAVCVSFGFAPRVELARQLGAAEVAGRFGPAVRAGASMETSVPGLFVAGELAGVAGAEVAEAEGEVAGSSAASYLGFDGSGASGPARTLDKRLRRGRDFALRLDKVYPIGAGWTAWLGSGTIFCRCEEVSWGTIRAATGRGAWTAREVRNLTRCGMGYCQGRVCGPALQLALAGLSGRPEGALGDLNKRPLAVPVEAETLSRGGA